MNEIQQPELNDLFFKYAHFFQNLPPQVFQVLVIILSLERYDLFSSKLKIAKVGNVIKFLYNL